MADQPEIIDIEPVGKPGPWRRLMVPLLFLLVIAGIITVAVIKIRQPPPAPVLAEATDVRSDVVQQGDSLAVAVDWQLTGGSPLGMAESVRVEVGLQNSGSPRVLTLGAEITSDTVRMPAPAPGQSASGYSCVAAISHGRLARESCTPWQFVRPTAEQAPSDTGTRRPSAAAAGGATAGRVRRIVVQPGGVQVDPDVEGRCAAWQRRNPERSVWVRVNQRAVPECTGPNGKPTVAQFCAFAVLEDGRRVNTAISAEIPYCEELFQEWSRERVS